MEHLVKVKVLWLADLIFEKLPKGNRILESMWISSWMYFNPSFDCILPPAKLHSCDGIEICYWANQRLITLRELMDKSNFLLIYSAWFWSKLRDCYFYLSKRLCVARCLSVCLFVSTVTKNTEWIFMYLWMRKKLLNHSHPELNPGTVEGFFNFAR